MQITQSFVQKGMETRLKNCEILYSLTQFDPINLENAYSILALFIPGFFGWCMTRDPPQPVIPLSLKSEGSNFLQVYVGTKSIFCNKKNQDESIMTSL